MKFYIGSYTRLGGPGVALCSLVDGKLSLLESDPLPNATYVILNRAQNRLFAISSDPVEASEGGSVASYDISSGGFVQLSRCDTIGSGPCHLCLDAQERFLYTANYFTGSVSAFALDENGGIIRRIQHVCHEGHSVHPVRQTGPHTHQVTFLPGTDLLCAVDLGLDQLVVYRQDLETGLLTHFSSSPMPGGIGPRHLLYASGGLTYLACEVDNQVAVLRWNGQTFDVLQTLSTLPEGYAQKNTASAIRLTGDGKRVLVSNRGHDSMAVYDVESDGLLRLHGIYATGDLFPRDFDLVDDHMLLIGHQNGALTLACLEEDGFHTMDSLAVNGCVCILIPQTKGAGCK